MTHTQIIEILNAETVTFKAEYFERVKAAAKNIFAHFEKIAALKEYTKEFYEFFHIKYEQKIDYSGKVMFVPQSGNYNRKEYYSKIRKYSEALSTVRGGFDAYLAEELDHAERHFEQTIAKLADRLIKKGVNNIESILSGRVGVNFNCEIKHDGKVTRAFTIVAEGPIQRAHFRFLVK